MCLSQAMGQPLTIPENPILLNSSSRLRRFASSGFLDPFHASLISLASLPQLTHLSLTSSKPSGTFLIVLLFATALLLVLSSLCAGQVRTSSVSRSQKGQGNLILVWGSI